MLDLLVPSLVFHETGNGIGEQGGLHLLQSLKTNKTLNCLRLQCNQFSLPFSNGLRDLLQAKSGLRVLDLQGCLTDSEAIYVVISALHPCSNLVELNLSANPIDDKVATKLALILGHGCCLQILNLSGILPFILIPFHLMNSFFFFFLFFLAECGISQEGTVQLAHALKSNRALRELLLRGFLSTADSFILLFSHFNPPLPSKANHAANPGAAAFASALQENSVLVSLDLSSNAVGDSGAEYLALALRQNTALRDLGLASEILFRLYSPCFVYSRFPRPSFR